MFGRGGGGGGAELAKLRAEVGRPCLLSDFSLSLFVCVCVCVCE